MSFRERLVEGAAERGVVLTPDSAEKMETHYRLLVHWNRVVLLTSLEGEDDILERHFLESLEAVGAFPEPARSETEPGRLLDVGSGNGFPAIPLLLAQPRYEGVLLEPAVRKRAFLKEVLREAGLEGRIRVLKNRIERPDDLEAQAPFDVLTVRAVARAKMILRGAALGLRPGGRALLFLGEEAMEPIRQGCPEGLTFEREIRLAGRDASFIAVVEKSA